METSCRDGRAAWTAVHVVSDLCRTGDQRKEHHTRREGRTAPHYMLLRSIEGREAEGQSDSMYYGGRLRCGPCR
jgi:hypothetical protein